MNKLCKIIVLAYIGEKIVLKMNKETEEYPKVRDSLDFCWKWIENKQADEEQIYEFLDDEDENDLVGYMIYANNVEDKKLYGVILGVVSYISHNVLETNKLPIPQFLSATDDKYYNLLINDVVNMQLVDCNKESFDKIIKYCRDKISKNDLIFGKAEIMDIG